MPARTELDRLAAARPAILSRTEDVVDAAEENRMLQHILSATTGVPAKANVPPPVRPHQLARRLTGALAAAAATALMAGGVLTLSRTGASSPRPRQSTAARPARTAPRTGPVIRLAGYTFTMPAGFTAIARPCAPMPDRTGLPMRGSNPFTAAASSTGGCLEAVLAAGPAAIIPHSAQPIQVGPYQGFVSRRPAVSVILYVKMPAAGGNHELILVARRLSAAQVVAIATSGLPATIGPIHVCTKNCG
jgi:hypothetical protein